MTRHGRLIGMASGESWTWGRMFPANDRRRERVIRKATLDLLQLESRRLLSGDVVTILPDSPLPSYRDPRTGQIFQPDADTAIVASDPSAGSTAAAPSVPLYPLSSVPVLNSLPGAHASIYLDFVGDYEASWGSYSNITTPAFDTDGDPTTFSSSELTAIKDIWSGVAEDYAPFDVNVTTVAPPDFANGDAVKMVIGGSGSWTGQVYGGLSYTGSFTNDMPNVSFIFSDNLGNGNARYTADATSHEAGHDFGLSHQSTYSGTTLTQEYSTGPGNGVAPIMGNSYSASRSLWWDGQSDISSTSIQDDMSVIADAANGFGYRPESAGTSPSTATLISTDDNQVNASGVILTGQDINYYTVLAGAGNATFTVNALASDNDYVPWVELFDATGTVLLASAEAPANGTSATISADLSQSGGYRLVIRGDGTYDDAGQYWMSGTIVPPPTSLFVAAPSGLSAAEVSPSRVDLSWLDNSDSESGYLVQRETGGGAWATIANLPANTTSYADNVVSQGVSYDYQVLGFNAAMTSTASNAASATIAVVVNGPPAAASGLAIVGRSNNSVTLSWSDDSDNESGFQIERSGNNGRSWTTISVVTAGSESFTDHGVRGGKHYAYRVVSVNAKGSASPSNLAGVTTPKFSALHLTRHSLAGAKAVRHSSAVHAKPAATIAGALPSLAQTSTPAAASVGIGVLPFSASPAIGFLVDWTPVTA